MTHALLLFSHGSVLCGAGERLRQVAEELAGHADLPIVEVGYLNYSTPTFATAFDRCVQRGARTVVIVPYFLVAGKFVRVDLPRVIEAARAAHPGITVKVAEAMEAHPRLRDALITCAQRPLPIDMWRQSLPHPADFCRSNPRCPLFGSLECSGGRGSGVGGRGSGRGEQNNNTPSLPPVPQYPIPNTRPLNLNPQPPTTDALLVMVHGSPRPEANDTMFAVVQMVRDLECFPIVEVGFMECNEPSIPQAIAACVQRGARRVVAVPYFLHLGNHVANDLPTLLEQAALQYPGVDFWMGDVLGNDPGIIDVLRDRFIAATVL